MQQRFKELGYPMKLIIYIMLFIATIIGMRYVAETRLPDGGRPPYLFLIWNTFLAWIPLGLAVVLDLVSLFESRSLRRSLYLIVGMLWLFFYPNAAYLITDMLHPFVRYPTQSSRFWEDISFWNHLNTVFFTAIIGLALGSLALASVHQLVRRAYGSFIGWGFAIVVLLLSSFGIYLGRFIRWNSWDILRSPMTVLRETVKYFLQIENLRHAIGFCKWIFLITAFCYLLLYLFGRLGSSMTAIERERERGYEAAAKHEATTEEGISCIGDQTVAAAKNRV
ncbi:MAG TPA: DUF1361 domain-containing protein [Paenibacillus sp.]